MFTPSEAAEMRRLLQEKQMADRDRQKALRGGMRRLGFFQAEPAQLRAPLRLHRGLQAREPPRPCRVRAVQTLHPTTSRSSTTGQPRPHLAPRPLTRGHGEPAAPGRDRTRDRRGHRGGTERVRCDRREPQIGTKVKRGLGGRGRRAARAGSGDQPPMRALSCTGTLAMSPLMLPLSG
jgi:hypothetical protein